MRLVLGLGCLIGNDKKLYEFVLPTVIKTSNIDLSTTTVKARGPVRCAIYKDNTQHILHSFLVISKYLVVSLSSKKPFLWFPRLLLICVSRRTTYSTRIFRLGTSLLMICGHLFLRQGRSCSLNEPNSVGLLKGRAPSNSSQICHRHYSCHLR